MCCWITDIITPLLAAVIGGLFALLGVIITLRYEIKTKKKEDIERVKPVLINYSYISELEKSSIPKYIFVSDGDTMDAAITGVFKNTDNGILFFDKIVTENKTYIPEDNSTVDKNTAFLVELHNLAGENLKFCKIYCHDILGNKYYYDASFVFEYNRKTEIVIGNIRPL